MDNLKLAINSENKNKTNTKTEQQDKKDTKTYCYICNLNNHRTECCNFNAKNPNRRLNYANNPRFNYNNTFTPRPQRGNYRQANSNNYWQQYRPHNSFQGPRFRNSVPGAQNNYFPGWGYSNPSVSGAIQPNSYSSDQQTHYNTQNQFAQAGNSNSFPQITYPAGNHQTYNNQSNSTNPPNQNLN